MSWFISTNKKYISEYCQISIVISCKLITIVLKLPLIDFCKLQATLGEADKEYQSIVGLVREVESIVKQHQVPGGLENPYTTLTAHVSIILIF